MLWAIVGILIIAWGVFAIVSSFVSMQDNPSTGGAAMILTIFGVVAIAIGSLMLWLSGAFQ